MAERAEAHSLDRLESSNQCGKRAYRRIGLAVDVEPDVGEPFEQLAHQRDRGPSVNAYFGQLVGGHLGDRAVDAARPREIGVVECHQHAVGAEVHVGLEVVESEPDGVLERRHRVLGCLARPTSMGERNRPRPIEIRVHESAQIERPASCQYSSFRRRL